MARMLFALGLAAGLAGAWFVTGLLWTAAAAALVAWLFLGPTRLHLL